MQRDRYHQDIHEKVIVMRCMLLFCAYITLPIMILHDKPAGLIVVGGTLLFCWALSEFIGWYEDRH